MKPIPDETGSTDKEAKLKLLREKLQNGAYYVDPVKLVEALARSVWRVQ